MGERNLNFDLENERRGTKSLKYDFAIERGKPAGVLPLWVADMDFKTSSYITDALLQVVEGGIFGYSESNETYFQSIVGWMKRRHNWDIESSWIVKTPGIVFALALAVKAYTEPGDGVLIQQPVYYPFSEVIADNDRRIINSPLVRGADGAYHMNFEDLEEKIVSEKIKLAFLCSPHNPVGRVWTLEELQTFGKICEKHNVIVISDEIHSDFVFEGKHTVFTQANPQLADRCIICTSPSKTFNLAGLQISNLIIRDEALRKAFKHQLDAAGYSQVGLPGLVACEAAYNHGEEWLEALLAYLRDNERFVRSYLETNLPKVKLGKLEGTYLVWLDFSAYELSKDELNHKIIYDANLWLDDGSIFGEDGIGFQRINIACTRATLQKALDQLKATFA